MRPFIWRPDNDYTIPLTDEMVEEAEKILGKKLPLSLIDLLKEKNGGVLRYDLHPAPKGYRFKWVGVHPLHELNLNNPRAILPYSQIMLDTWEMPDDLVLIAGDGHTWVALDYRDLANGQEPPVVFVDNNEDIVYFLAPNFETFLHGLVSSEIDHVLGFVRVGNLWEKLLEQLNHALEVKFVEEIHNYYEKSFITLHTEWESSVLLGHKSRLVLATNKTHINALDFPMAADCDWIFRYDVKESIAEQIYDQIVHGCSFQVLKLHTPISWCE